MTGVPPKTDEVLSQSTHRDSAGPFASLDEYLEASKQNYEACVDMVHHDLSVEGVQATVRMHHLRFDANGVPMVTDLAQCLANHIIMYCLSARNRSSRPDLLESTKLGHEARKLFIRPEATEDDPDRTGEAGEILLYFLMETVLGAPQVVAKMDLKDNPRLEVHGSDGIHMRWHPEDQQVDIFFGEAKLYQGVGAAISATIKSIESFHANGMRQHEFGIVTKHFKLVGNELRGAVKDLLDSGIPGPSARINHACLIGYDWSEYGKLPALSQDALSEEFCKRYQKDAPRLHELLKDRFEGFSRKELRFEVFFLPFKSVQDFRDAFNEALK